MDPFTAVGVAASIISLIQVANVLLKIITKHPQRLLRGGCSDPLRNAARKQHLQGILEEFIQTLRSAQSVSQGTFDYTLSQLQELRPMLEYTENPCQRCPSFMKCIWNCVRSTHVYAKLEEAETKLQSLRTEVILTQVGELVRRSQPSTIYNTMVDMPSSNVGLDRSGEVLRFLDESQQQELRVIGIHGQPGLGKTTILNKVWKEASSKSLFAPWAYVQLGEKLTPKELCEVQSTILEQLDGGKVDFPSDAFGRVKLKQHFQELRKGNKPMFLAIDNVWEAESLQKLLSDNICSDNLPRLSCIALTSRDFEVVKALSSLCHLQESNHLQVLFLSPSYLPPEDSEALFAKCLHIAAFTACAVVASLGTTLWGSSASAHNFGGSIPG